MWMPAFFMELPRFAAGLNFSESAVRDRVAGNATLEGQQISRVQICGQIGGQNALLPGDHGPRAVTDQGELRRRHDAQIMLHILHSALLIKAHDQPYAAAHRQPQLPDAPHGVQRHDARAFIIACAPPNQISVLHSGAIGVKGPAGSLRHYIQMPQYPQLRPAVPLHHQADAVVVVVLPLKAPLPADFNRLVRAAGAALPHGAASARLAYAPDLDQGGQIVCQFLLMRGGPLPHARQCLFRHPLHSSLSCLAHQ